MKRREQLIRYSVLGALLLVVWLTMLLPTWGATYARSIYPHIAWGLSPFSRWIPFAVGDLFIFLSLVGLIVYPLYRRIRKRPVRRILSGMLEYLAWLYVWFYLAWGLNYAQPNFYQRTGIPVASYTPEGFHAFLTEYIDRLNASYLPITAAPEPEMLRREVVKGYNQISSRLGVHRPSYPPRSKTMLFTPLASLVGVSGSMAPFFCEFTLNGELPPSQYAGTYAHELAHLLGITSEAEANFYAYQVCTRSEVGSIRFCGYFSVLSHLLNSAQSLLSESEFEALLNRIRPEILELARANHHHWMERYSPLIGAVQEWIYDLYLKGNRIESGRKNYSEVVGLLLSYHELVGQEAKADRSPNPPGD